MCMVNVINTKHRCLALKGLLLMTQWTTYQAPKAWKCYFENIAYVSNSPLLKVVSIFVGKVSE